MKYLLVVLFSGLLVSCNLFASKEKKMRKLVEQEMRDINWNDIDSYPLFGNCDETQTKKGQRECFEQEVLLHCSRSLKEFEFVLLSGTNPTVQVDFLVDQDGQISVLDIQKDAAIDSQMPEFDQIITQSLKNMPPLAPALKRGIPVKAKFRIPIILNTE
ncbi:hypothetical protein FK220_003890 [Flavobacteriaceae bacterium TP-CH-4]|uniref:TonB C-terminal domain-containing protein n=1 Tax=Pelagihabitans pacificus TaxID=2696054 RepID=A0A967AQR8_9FLAO|nr:hypothetical protein [Pelagihabitans pacificus]NHF58464.1 hypothetical protein [Pelagihabitans pacificus]